MGGKGEGSGNWVPPCPPPQICFITSGPDYIYNQFYSKFLHLLMEGGYSWHNDCLKVFRSSIMTLGSKVKVKYT